jgi:hypothetical protein
MKKVSSRLSVLTIGLFAALFQMMAGAEDLGATQTAVKSMSESQKVEKVREVLKGGGHLEMYNFVSKQKEVIGDPMSLTKQKAKEFLPPIEEVQKIFDIYAEDHPAYAALIKSYTDLQESLQQGGVVAGSGAEVPAIQP